ncbi:hypothetical protein IQ235_01970 [Oscillatoriales cyanobacterium LEGE 11467]|uniref:Uncharacterized protein n=1 Tax=Zarconia navalis LEGE 11467 TaxID=1828826 RepID=A0A928Z7D3_9CYAN|nr:hypothetical protein [Zarconia navalis]MBE9039563.1 hypothetical protein [Zarconia navalis LEGE 11467]
MHDSEKLALVLSYFSLPEEKRPPISPSVNRHADPKLDGMYYLTFSDGDFTSQEPIDVMVAILSDLLNGYSLRIVDEPGYEKHGVEIDRLSDKINDWEMLDEEMLDEVEELSSTKILNEIS